MLIGQQSSALVTVLYVYTQSRVRNPMAYFIFSYWFPAVHGDDVIMPLTIIIFRWAKYNYYIILTDYNYRYRHKNHTFCEKISSHNSVAP